MIDQELLACFCDEAADLLVKWEEVVLKIEKAPSIDVFNELFRVAHNLKGSSRCVGMDQFGNFIHKIEDGITLLKSGEAEANPKVVQHLYQAHTMIVNWLNQARVQGDYEDPNWKQFINEYLSSFQKNTNESVVAKEEPKVQKEEPKLEVKEQEPEAKHREEPKVENKPKSIKPINVEQKNSSADESVRVSSKKLDQIMELVGELSIHQSVIFHSKEVEQNLNPLLTRASYDSNKLIRDLYDRAISLRMHSVQPVFQRLERSIREIARTLGKEVEVILEGAEVELDKTVCDRIMEPLIHMVRNSVDHGIEMPEIREASGKPRNGTVKVTAVNDSGGVTICIEDDGKGLAKDKILQKALSKGIIQPGTVLSQQEVFALIFLPGFSTAEKVTDVSGRGVGMDVVMRTIDELQGQASIMSEEGKGTRFIISLPTTLSLIDALIVEYQGSQYAIPVSMVDEVIDLAYLNIDSKCKILRLRDEIIPMQYLSSFLKITSRQYSENVLAALIAKQGKKRVAFFIDRILGQQQIVVRSLSQGMTQVFGFCGGTILANGEPGLIIDLKQISKKYFDLVQPSGEGKAA